MQITAEHAIARLVRHGWRYVSCKNTHNRTLARYQMIRPGASEPEWLRGSALKAIVLHTL
jgi:hypothetical protein